MLSILRRNAGSWAIKIILSFIALTFIWWGVGTYSERDRNVAAKVGGETITTSELLEAVAGLDLEELVIAQRQPAEFFDQFLVVLHHLPGRVVGQGYQPGLWRLAE